MKLLSGQKDRVGENLNWFFFRAFPLAGYFFKFSPGKYGRGMSSVRHDITKDELSAYIPHFLTGFCHIF